MKKSVSFYFGFLLLGIISPVQCGDFINLGFDAPQLNNLQIDADTQTPYGTPGDLIPGWSVTQDDIPIGRVWFLNTGNRAPLTLSKLNNSPGGFMVQYGWRPFDQPFKSTQFMQAGTVPEWAVTLEFMWAWSAPTFDPRSPLLINGEVVPIYEVPDRGHYYTADVGRWAGQDVTLSFQFPAENVGILDNIRFTVPEPSTWALLGLGAAVLTWGRRSGRRQRGKR